MNNIVKVDMIPKSFGVRTLSCSQGDTKREFKFTLNDANQTIDTSDVEIALPQFPVYKNGTEEILPTNGSVPSTAPIIADIQYPQGLLADQEFTYRESPSEEDGFAKPKSIKGNTLGWNQLCRTLTSGNWAIVGAGSGTLTFADGVATFSTTNNYGRFLYTPGNLVNGHKYLLSVEIKAYANASINYALGSQSSYGSQGCICLTGNVQDANWHRYTSVGTFTSGTDDKVLVQNNSGASNLHEIQVRNIMYFALTQMGLDISSPSEFTSLFSLPYYDFNQGSLLSFNGNGIKTVGKNLLSYNGENLPYNANGVSITREDNIYKVVASNPSGYPFARISTIHYLPKGQYTVTMLGAESSGTGIAWRLIDRNVSPAKIFVNASATVTTFTLNEDAHDVYFEITIDASKFSAGAWDVRFQLNMGTPSDYEPYTESTLSLPISTYFPTGMKSAGNVYDELTESKAITRIGAVDLGSLTWTYSSTAGHLYFNSTGINTLVKKASAAAYANIVCPKYSVISENEAYNNLKVGIGITQSGAVRVYDPTYTDVSTFTSAMSGIYLYYELATETETEITSASLVTENGEIQLLPQDGYLVGTVNSSVSRKSGMFDAKVKLTGGDGTVYSNKLQLYVERSPK